MMFRRQVLTLLPDATTVHTAAILCLGFPFAVAKVPTASAADYLSRIIGLVVFTDPRSRLETFSTACSFSSDAQTESRWCAGRNTRWTGHTRPEAAQPIRFRMPTTLHRFAEIVLDVRGRGGWSWRRRPMDEGIRQRILTP
jgi:hypothetical protein